MAVDYDLVVIGSTIAAINAAISATHFKARVALVATLPLGDPMLLQQQVLREVGLATRQTSPGVPGGKEPVPASERLATANQWAEMVDATLGDLTSPAQLAALGVDVILGTGQFQRSPLIFAVNGRSLRARNYLLVTRRVSRPTAIPGLDNLSYKTGDPILTQLSNRQALQPQAWGVIGGGIAAVELSQALARLGCQVTMLVPESRLLPQEDWEAATWLQAQLEADGVKILNGCKIAEVRGTAEAKHLYTSAGILTAEQILLTTDQQPAVTGLNLEGVGVEWNQRGIRVNAKLQTTNPHIYACGDGLGGYALPHIACYEARIAVRNALFWPRFQVNYHGIPWAVFTDPELARVGLTENQARQQYGDTVRVERQFYKTLARAQIQGETTGFCKLIGTAKGRFLGAHLLGPIASETIFVLALAMEQGLKIQELAEAVPISPTFAEIIAQAAGAWSASNPQGWRTEAWEYFFNLRRQWTN